MNEVNHTFRQLVRMVVIVITLACASSSPADQDIYTDAITDGWADWSYNAARNFTNTSPVHGGSKSISVTATNYGALYLHTSAQDSSLFTNLTFWINGVSTGDVDARLNEVAEKTSCHLPPAG